MFKDFFIFSKTVLITYVLGTDSERRNIEIRINTAYFD